MKILYISNPNSIHTRRWIKWFANHGHLTALIADTPLANPWKDIPVYDLASRFNVRLVRYWVWGMWTRGIIRSWQPQILHAHRVSSAGWTGMLTGFHPLVVTPWGSDLYRQAASSRLARYAAGMTLKNADLVTADSDDLRRLAIEHGARPSRSHLVGWGVDLDHFNPHSLVDMDKYDSTHLHTVLCPRGVNPVYKQKTIVKAIPAVRAEFPDVQFIFRDYNREPQYHQEIISLVDQMGLQGSVAWIGQVEPYEQLADLYHQADVVVSVAKTDATPVSLLEALACGAPVIAGDVPSLREWISDGLNGYLVNPDDPETLSVRILQIFRDPDIRRRFKEHNWTMIQKRADHEKEMSRMEALYQELLR